MGRIWVLDTETKGTGAEMVPLEKVESSSRLSRGPVVVQPKAERAPAPAAPKRPARFKVVDVMTEQVLAEGADARATVAVLAGVRSIVDVRVYVWDHEAEGWRKLTIGEQRALWRLRGR